METLETWVQLIFIIALAKYCLKAALSGSLWAIAGYAAAAAIVAFLLYPFIIEQPTTVIRQLLGNRTMVENIALLTTAEAIAGIFIAVYLLDNYFKPKAKRTKRAFALKIMPGVLVFFAIGYFELLFFKFRAGNDFTATALLYVVLLFAVVMSASLIFKYAMKGESLKLEVKVLLNMAILVLGLLISSSVADYNISHAQTKVEWGALAALISAAAALFALGVWLQKINFKKIFKKQS